MKGISVMVRAQGGEQRQRILEFEAGGCTGMISIRQLPEGHLPTRVLVDVYRTDPGVVVTGPGTLDQDTVDRVLRAFGTSYDPEAPSHVAAMQRLLAGG